MKLRARPAGVLLVLAGVVACEIPTEMPRWETTWIAPGEESTVSVIELLPAGLAVNEDSSAFLLTIDPVDDAWTLAEFCPACPAVTATAPKPAFNETVSTTNPLPASVLSAEVDGGTLRMELVNGFDFDPLRPGVAADSGTLTIVVTSGAATVASLVVEGADSAFAPGDTLSLALGFLPSTVGSALEVALTLDSPAGDVTELSPTDALEIRITSEGVVVPEATISLSGHQVEGDAAELDLEDVDLGDRLREGSIFLDIENPFGVTGDLLLTIDPNEGAPIVKPVQLEAGSSTAQIDFSEAELERIVGSVSSMTFGGTVDGASVTVSPDMAIAVSMRLRVTIEVGGESDENDD